MAMAMAMAVAGAGVARVLAVEEGVGSRAGAGFLAPVMNLESVVQALLVAVVVGLIVVKLRAPKLKMPPGPVALPVVGNWLQVCFSLHFHLLSRYSLQLLLYRLYLIDRIIDSCYEFANADEFMDT